MRGDLPRDVRQSELGRVSIREVPNPLARIVSVAVRPAWSAQPWNGLGPKRPPASDVTGPSRHLVAATGFKPRAHGCYLRRIVRSH